MFDIGADELVTIVVVAVVVIGPKDLPKALRVAGRWIGKARRVSNHFRAGIETMIREAELAEMEEKWRQHNAAIMARTAEGQSPAEAADQHRPPLPDVSCPPGPAGEAPPP